MSLWIPGGGPAGGGGSVDPVTPPVAASEAVASGGSLADVTFSAFTDPGGRIASYTATATNVAGSATISGTDLGPYAISGAADGEVLLVELDAKDASGDVVATAVYTGVIATAATGWVEMKSIDYSTLTHQSLAVGTHVVDGETIVVTDATGAIDANGLTPGAGSMNHEIDSYLTDTERPIFVQLEMVNVTWSGSDPVRARVAFAGTGGEMPSIQLNTAVSGADLNTQPQWQDNTTIGGTGAFATGDSNVAVLAGNPTSFWVNALILQGHVITWASTSRVEPATIAAVMAMDSAKHSISMTETDEINTGWWAALYVGARPVSTTHSIGSAYIYEHQG